MGVIWHGVFVPFGIDNGWLPVPAQAHDRPNIQIIFKDRKGSIIRQNKGMIVGCTLAAFPFLETEQVFPAPLARKQKLSAGHYIIIAQ